MLSWAANCCMSIPILLQSIGSDWSDFCLLLQQKLRALKASKCQNSDNDINFFHGYSPLGFKLDFATF
jgi:hypothetical protein